MKHPWDADDGLFQTDRLIFRDWLLADRDVLHAICADTRVMQFVGSGQPWSRNETQRFIAAAIEMRETHGYCRWALVHRADSRLVGFCGFVSADACIEIGWRLAPEYWRQGLASEAARRAVTYGFESLGFDRIVATIDGANRASLRVAEKLHMTPDRHFQDNGREMVVYSVSCGSEHDP